MSRLILFLLSTCSMLLGACTTLDLPDTPPAAVEPIRTESRPDPAWLDTRARLGVTLGEEHRVDVQTMDDGAMLLRLPAAEGFPRDSAEPTAALKAMLDVVAAALADAPDTALKVLGHTDSIGSELYNLELSIRRAEAVMEYLRARNIALARLRANGRGEAEPIADNATVEGRAVNRRVEIIVRPVD